jgi:stress-induced morphogen
MENNYIKTFEQFVNEREDKIKGSKGDKLEAKDVNQDELKVGIAVEYEHAKDNKEIAIDIAIDHLAEDPKYYSKLVASGIVDEPEAIKLAKELLGVESKNESLDEGFSSQTMLTNLTPKIQQMIDKLKKDFKKYNIEIIDNSKWLDKERLKDSYTLTISSKNFWTNDDTSELKKRINKIYKLAK